jgi:hypothetical protein
MTAAEPIVTIKRYRTGDFNISLRLCAFAVNSREKP